MAPFPLTERVPGAARQLCRGDALFRRAQTLERASYLYVETVHVRVRPFRFVSRLHALVSSAGARCCSARTYFSLILTH